MGIYRKWKQALSNPKPQSILAAKLSDPMPKAPNYVPDNGAVEDLGGPTPENSKAQMTILTSFKTPEKTIKQVKDVVNKGAKPAEPMWPV